MLQRYILVIVSLFFLAGCTSVPSEPYKETNVNTSSNNLTPSSVLPQPTESPLSRYDLEKQKYLLARGADIFNFSELTADNCDATVYDYRLLLDETEDEIDDIQDELLEEERDLQKARSALQNALQNGTERAADRARDEIDEEEEDVDAVEDFLEERTEYFRKLKLVFSTMKEECTLLKARA